MNKQITNQIYYRANQTKIKLRRKNRYQLTKKQKRERENQQISKYSQAENYKVLMTLKEYTLLNKDKQKKWSNFCWTLQDLAAVGVHNISEIMRLCELGENLIVDYWKIAKKEVWRGKRWNSLTPEQQEKLMRYWSYEKARKENNFLTITEQLEQQSKEYLAEIESAKFHEERGKIKCPCYSCFESKRLQNEFKRQLFEDDQQEKSLMVESECANCGEYKKVDPDSGLCRKCY